MQRASAYVNDLMTPSLRLGVTGLARAGKTVFITALVHNLMVGGRLRFLKAAEDRRITRVYLEPQPDDTVPRFAYEDHLAALTAGETRRWPESTRAIAQLRLTVEYEPLGWLGLLDPGRLHIDIIDYPGEWLLDLPMLSLSFEAWSRQQWAQIESAEGQAARTFTSFVREALADDAMGDDEQRAIEGARAFTAYLAEARAADHALSLVGPGRFLMPGDLEGSPLLTFFPLPPARNLTSQTLGDVGATSPRSASASPSASDGLAALLARRYASYKTHVVQPFYRDHFAKLDRQIVLVDALSALNAGPQAMADLSTSLGAILESFKPGARTLLSSILFRRIDRLLFAATKADHLHHTSHDRLRGMLRVLTDTAIGRATFAGAEVEVMALAALRATQEVDMRQSGEVLPCIKGVPLAGERLAEQQFDGATAVAVFPGDLPTDAAALIKQGREPASDPMERDVRVIRFRPPVLSAPRDAKGVPRPGQPLVLPHIKLDHALEFLIGDRLR